MKEDARLSESHLFALNLPYGACREEVLVRMGLGRSLKKGLGACGHFINEKASWSAVDCLGPHPNKYRSSSKMYFTTVIHWARSTPHRI